ncbi:MAG: CRP/FNR family cyclic AMP-dependent transcriptional regulator [Myxococcota bacterium]|jgi:CRP/FNR family cyclic AMP-dependent transcriptional regulator
MGWSPDASFARFSRRFFSVRFRSQSRGLVLTGSDNTVVQVRRSFERVFASGETIFEEGDAGDVLFIIQSGEVAVSRRALNGRHLIANLGPGDFFGEMCVIMSEPRTARAAATRETRLLQLDGETLEAMCIERPEIAIRIISRLTVRLIDSERRLAVLGVDDLLRPIVRALLRNAEAPDDQGVRFPGSLRDLASESGLSMLEAHYGLHQLFDQRLLRLVDDCLVAKDVDSLASCLDTGS